MTRAPGPDPNDSPELSSLSARYRLNRLTPLDQKYLAGAGPILRAQLELNRAPRNDPWIEDVELANRLIAYLKLRVEELESEISLEHLRPLDRPFHKLGETIAAFITSPLSLLWLVIAAVIFWLGFSNM